MIEYVEESRLGVHTIRKDGMFMGHVVHRATEDPWITMHDLYRWDAEKRQCVLFGTVDTWGALGPKIKEMVDL